MKKVALYQKSIPFYGIYATMSMFNAKYMLKKILPFFVLLCVPFFAQAQSYPQPRGFVNDYANIIEDSTERRLESQLADLEKKTTKEISVLTVESLEGVTVEEYAVEVFERWGVGKEGEDNGVLFLVARDDRKMRIEVGYGLEGDLTDAQSKRILDQDVKPFLSNDQFSEGIDAGVQKIAGVVAGDIENTVAEEDPVRNFFGGLIFGFFDFFGGVFNFVIFVLVLYSIYRRRRGGKGGFPPIFFGGGGFGGGSSGGGFGGFGGGGSGGGGSSSDF